MGLAVGIGLGLTLGGAPPQVPTSGLALWAETLAGRVWTTAAGSTAAGSTDPLGRTDPMRSGLPTLTQPTAGSRPTLALDAAGRLEARGDGVGAHLLPSAALSGLADFTAYARVTHTAAAVCVPYGSTVNSGTAAFLGLYSDGKAYFLPGDGSVLSIACTLTGNLLLRFRRSGTSVRFAATGQADAAMALGGGSAASGWTCDALLQRGSDATAAGNGCSAWVAYSRALSAAEMTGVERYLIGAVL